MLNLIAGALGNNLNLHFLGGTSEKIEVGPLKFGSTESKRTFQPLWGTSKLNMMKKGAPGSPGRSFGPVEDLETFVPTEWWRALFGSTYLLTDADVMDESVTQREVTRFIELLHLQPQESILDLCCGHGRHTLELARRGIIAEGLDRSRYLIRKAREAARRESLSVRFREGDSRRLAYHDRTFDAVMLAGNSFGYFDTAEDNLKVLHEIARVLKADGRLLLDVVDADFMREHFMPRSWEWLDARHFVCRE